MCLICGKNAPVSAVGGYNRCHHCNSYVAAFLPDHRNVQKVLEDHFSYIIDRQKQTSNVRIHQGRLDTLKKFSKTIHRVLDVGCGDGGFLTFMLARGYKSFGYDKSKKIQKYLRDQHIPNYNNLRDIPDHSFDVVTCFDVIEHTTDPQGLIRNIKEKLKRNGILIITTPNAKSFSSLVLGQKWWVFGPTAHFVLFSPRSLKLLLTNQGFEVLDVSTDTLTPWFTPPEKVLFRVLNKLIYLATLPFHTFLFVHYLGDNIQVVARKNRSEFIKLSYALDRKKNKL